MRVSDFLSSADVTIGAAFADKQKLLEELSRRAAAIVDLEPDLILAELQKREELGSTGMAAAWRYRMRAFITCTSRSGCLFVSRSRSNSMRWMANR